MKLFKAEVRFKRKHHDRTGVELVVHARSRAAAEKHIGTRYPASELEHIVELNSETKHFVIADLVDALI
jgi:hypothetical protein